MPSQFNFGLEPYDESGQDYGLEPYEAPTSGFRGLLDQFNKWDAPLLNAEPYGEAFGKRIEEDVPSWLGGAVAKGAFPAFSSIADLIAGDYNPSYLLGGMARGAGNLVTELSRPTNVAAILLSGGAGAAGRYGAGTLTRGLTYGARAASAPATVQGATSLYDELSNDQPWGLQKIANLGMGVAGLAGGLAGVFEPVPHIHAPEVPRIEPSPTEVGGQGRLFEAGPVRGPEDLSGATQESLLPITEEPYQPEFKYGPYRSPRGKFMAEPEPFRRPGEQQYRFPYDLFEPKVTSPREIPYEGVTPPSRPTPVQTGTLPDVVTITNPTEQVPKYQALGYVPVEGLFFKDPSTGANFPQWVRKELAPLYAKKVRPAMGPQIETGNINVTPGQDIQVPVEKVDAGYTQRMMDAGYRIAGKTADGRQVIFRETGRLGEKTRVSEIGEEGGGRNFLSEATGIPPDDYLRMEVGDRVTVLRNMQGQYAEHGARVAGKELLQNAIDATQTGGKVDVTLNFKTTGKGPSITVSDQGPGLNIDLLKKEYVTLTGSGKRGVPSITGRATIGEMGVGKATYLLGTDSFEISTVAREPDGTVWKYEVSGNPDAMIGEDTAGNQVAPIKINKTPMPSNTPTGTTVTVYDKQVENLRAARDYFRTFAQYSDSPITVEIKNNQYNSSGWNPPDVVNPRITPPGQHVIADSAPGGDFSISVPPNAIWNENAQTITAVLSNRGMFQGAETIYLSGRGRIPDRVIVDIQPTVSAQDARNYPLTSPTRERMKGPFHDKVREAIDTHLMEAARQKQLQDIQAAYDALVPAMNARTGQPLRFVTNDRGGRYTPEELNAFNNSPRIQVIGNELVSMLERLDSLFPTEQVSKTVKLGFDLADPNKGGVNIPNISNTAENAILVNFFSALQAAPTNPRIAAERIAHTLLHEFNHNIVREEGSRFTWSLIDVDSKFGTLERADIADAIHIALTDATGRYAPEVQGLLQQHIAARGRPDTTIDFLARQAEGRFLADTGQGGIPDRDRVARAGTTTERVKNLMKRFATEETGTFTPGEAWENVKQKTGWGMGGTKYAAHDPKEYNFIKEGLMFPSAATTTGDLSPIGRQGLTQINTPEFWIAAGKAFKGLSYEGFKQIDRDLRSKRIHQKEFNPEKGTWGPSFADKVGLKLFTPASEPGPRAEAVASRWLETGGFLGPETVFGARNLPRAVYSGSIGKYYVRPTNRFYITFLNHLKTNRMEYLMDRARDMSIQAFETGKAPMPGILGGVHLPEFLGGGDIGFKKSYTREQALDINPWTNLDRAKEIADFINTATGQAPLKTHIAPFKQAEISFEKAAGVLGHVLFSPGLLASRVRMLNPSTYIMASPFVRKQYAKAAIGAILGWGAFTTMAQFAAQANNEDAEIVTDPTNADFGKFRIGNTRLDFGGSFLQFAVLLGRAWKGGWTSSSNPQEGMHPFGKGFQAETQMTNLIKFGVNKLNPIAKFAWDVANASERVPFQVGDRTAQLFVSLFMQDLIELFTKNKDVAPGWMLPVLFGAGTQTYEKGGQLGREEGKFLTPEQDWTVKGGGGLRSLMPWNWDEQIQ